MAQGLNAVPGSVYQVLAGTAAAHVGVGAPGGNGGAGSGGALGVAAVSATDCVGADAGAATAEEIKLVPPVVGLVPPPQAAKSGTEPIRLAACCNNTRRDRSMGSSLFKIRTPML